MSSEQQLPIHHAPEASHGEFSRKVGFEVGYDDLTLGKSKDKPQLITEAEQRVFFEQAMQWQVSADITRLQHGTFKSKPASLVALRVDFSNPGTQGWNRMAAARIKIQFHPASRGEPFPVVRVFAPFLAQAQVTPATVTSQKTTTVGPILDQVPLSIKVGLSKETASTKQFAQTLQKQLDGHLWRSSDAKEAGVEDSNAVVWDVKEHSGFKEGIPRVVQTAVVISRAAPLVHATVEVQVRTSWGLSLLASVWPRSSRLVLNERVAFQRIPSVRDFDDLTEEQYAELVRLDLPTEVVIATNRMQGS